MATKVQGAKNRQAAAIKEKEVLESVADLSLDAVSSNITTTQVEVQQTLAGVTAKLVEQLQVLRNIEEAIRLKVEEMNQLRGIEVASTTLDELEAEIAAKRQAWEIEEASHKRQAAEVLAQLRKERVREEEEYQYKLSQDHQKQQDALAALMAKEEKEHREKLEKLQKEWAEHEAELKKREQELTELRAFKEAAPEMIRKAENAAGIVAGNSVKKEYEQKMALAAKDMELEKRLSEQKIVALEQTIAKQQAQIDDLKRQVEQAQRDVKEISSKALDSASGRATTEALQRLMEKEPVSAKPGK
jgi:hypothetical protein